MFKKMIVILLALVLVCSGIPMTANAATTVAITKQPTSLTVADGMQAVVSFTAQGDGLTYKWYYKNAWESKFTLTTSFAGNTYSVQMNDSRDGRQLYCVVTDKYGSSVQTNTVTIGMDKTQTKVSITKQPTSATVANGQMATVSFTAAGEGLTYKWYYKNAWESKFTLTTTFTGNTYSAQMNVDRNGRQIYCVVTDKYGNAAQTNTVSINMSSGTTTGKVTITRQPTSVTVANGQMATVSFTAAGEGLTYKWYYKNAWESKFTLTTTFTGNTYSAQMNVDRNGRQIYCVVTDKYGNTAQTNTVSINMTTPASRVSITKQPVSVKVAQGEMAVVSFVAEGDGLRYKWYYKNAWETKFTLTTTFNANTYSAQMNDSRSGRQLYCVITDRYGNSVQTNTVTISMKGNAVKIATQPVSVSVEDGADVVIRFVAEGEGLTYKWYYKNAWETKFSFTTSFSGNTYATTMNATRNGRQVYCVVTDKYGNSVQTNIVTMSLAHSPLYISGVQTNDVIRWYNEVCLDAEFSNGNDVSVVQKWVSPIYYSISGSPTAKDIEVVRSTAQWLNSIPGFPGMYEAQSPLQANLNINLVSEQEMINIMGTQFYGCDGGVTIWWNGNQQVYKGVICVRSDIDQYVRNSVIQEEIYNGMGPLQDTSLRTDSLIYSGYSTPQQPTQVDKLIMTLLYNTKITCGMNAAQCEKVIRELYY